MKAIGLRISPEIPFLLLASAVLIAIGSTAFAGFLSFSYLIQQAQIASFLGVIALGAFFVIMIGHIDLSVPWTITATGIASTWVTAATAGQTEYAWLAVPTGLAVGLAIGLINGIGAVVLRVPSMIWTLGVNAVILGFCVVITGGFAPSGRAPDTMRLLAVGRTFGVPNSALLWLALVFLTVAFLRHTVLGKSIIAIGNGERAAYLSGIRTNLVIIFCFCAGGVMSALGGLLLVGYSNQAYQAMGDPFLLPVIAAVVVGGTRLQGGKGSAAAVAIAVLFLSLLTSVLSVFQVGEAVRQCVYGAVMLVMLVAYGRLQRSGP